MVFKEQTDRLDKLLREGYTARDINARIYKLKNTIVGQKIKPTVRFWLSLAKPSFKLKKYYKFKLCYQKSCINS